MYPSRVPGKRNTPWKLVCNTLEYFFCTRPIPSSSSVSMLLLHRLWTSSICCSLLSCNYIRRFKQTLKKQNRRRKWNPSRCPLVHQHPAPFLSCHWQPLKSTSKIFQVRVQYYIIFPNLNDVIYQQSYWLICCSQTAISFRCCHCGFE